MKYILFSVTLAYFLTMGIKDVHSKETSRENSCKKSLELMQITLKKYHYSVTALDSEREAVLSSKYTTQLKDMFQGILLESEKLELEKNQNALKSGDILAQISKKSCSFFDKQAQIVQASFKRLKSRILSEKELALQIQKHKRSEIVYSRPFYPKSFDKDLGVYILDTLTDKYAQTLAMANSQKAASFVAMLYLQSIRDLEQELKTLSSDLMLSSFVSTLDPHSSFYTVSELQQMQGSMLNLKLGGILGSLTPHGYMYGDKILVSIGGKSTFYMSVYDVLNQMLQASPDSNTKIKTGILQNKEVINLKEEPFLGLSGKFGSSKMTSSLVNRNGKNILVFKIPTFYQGMDEEIKKELDQKVSSVVLDLRDNLDEDVLDDSQIQVAQNIASLFLKKKIFYQIQIRGFKLGTLETAGDDPIYNGMIEVVVNSATSHMAEVLAAALKENNRAIVVGPEHTNGYGTLQALIGPEEGLPIDGLLRLTHGEFYSPLGNPIQREGITPNILLDSQQQRIIPKEKDLTNAIATTSLKDTKEKLSQEWIDGLISNSNQRIPSLMREDFYPREDYFNEEILHIAEDLADINLP